jgi:hypothetical protein
LEELLDRQFVLGGKRVDTVAVDLGIVAMGHARSLTHIGKSRSYHSDCWTRPAGRTQAGSSGVVTLDPHERSIGDRLGTCGVMGTEWPSLCPTRRGLEDLAASGDHRLGEGPRALSIRSCCSAKPVSSL